MEIDRFLQKGKNLGTFDSLTMFYQVQSQLHIKIRLREIREKHDNLSYDSC